MVFGGTLVWVLSGWEFPSRPSFVVALRVWLDDRDVNCIRQSFQVPDQVCAVCEGAEEACSRWSASFFSLTKCSPTNVEMVSSSLGWEFPVRFNQAMPSSILDLQDRGH